MRRSPTPLPALLTVLLLLAPALAQDTKPPPKPKEGGGGGIRMGTGADEPEKEEPQAPVVPELPEKSEPELLVEVLGKWPAQEAKRASIRLASQPTVAYPLLAKKLLERDHDWRMIAGVSATLGKIGDVRSLELIEAKLQDRKLFLHSAPLLDAIVRIDPVGAKARLTATLLHPASAVVEEARRRLESRVAAIDVPPLRDVYEAGGPAAREAAVRLLFKADPDATRPDLVRALRDKAPNVCVTSARLLADDPAPEALEFIRRATRSPVERQLAYGYFALALRNAKTTENLVDETETRLVLGGTGLKSLEPLNRAVAAILLADVGYYHGDPAVDDVLESQVAPALVDALVGRSFWKDQSSISVAALQRLQRLTGQLALRSDREWAAWWDLNRDTFKARRVLVRVPDGDIDSLVVTVSGEASPGGGVTTFIVSASSLLSQVPGEVVLMLPLERARELAAQINGSGVLRAAEGLTGELETRGPLTLTVGCRGRQRRVVVKMDEASDAVRALMGDLARFRQLYAWQRYRPAGTGLDLETWVAGTAPAFGPGTSESDRAAVLASLIVASLDDARSESWILESLRELEALPGLGAALGHENALVLVRQLGARNHLDIISEHYVRVLAKAGLDETHDVLLTFLVEHPGPRGDELFELVLENADDTQLRGALADTRAVVRMAALKSLRSESLEGRGGEAARELLDDPQLDVRREAIKALGRTRTEAARDGLEELASENGELRVAALDSLGLLGGKESLPTLMLAFTDPEPALRIAAIEALASTGEPEGLSAIVFGMTGDPSALVREVASRTITRLGTARAAAELRKLAIDPAQPAGPRARAVRGMAQLLGPGSGGDLRRLVDDESPEVADEAALALSRWRDGAAVPRLVEMLRAGRHETRARNGLESISLEGFDQEDREFLADIYAGWYEENKSLGPRGWFRNALVFRDLDDPALRAWSQGEAARQVVPVMLPILRRQEWYLRRAADLALRELLGKTVGEQEPWTRDSDVERMAREWEKIWAEALGR